MNSKRTSSRASMGATISKEDALRTENKRLLAENERLLNDRRERIATAVCAAILGASEDAEADIPYAAGVAVRAADVLANALERCVTCGGGGAEDMDGDRPVMCWDCKGSGYRHGGKKGKSNDE